MFSTGYPPLSLCEGGPWLLLFVYGLREMMLELEQWWHTKMVHEVGSTSKRFYTIAPGFGD